MWEQANMVITPPESSEMTGTGTILTTVQLKELKSRENLQFPDAVSSTGLQEKRLKAKNLFDQSIRKTWLLKNQILQDMIQPPILNQTYRTLRKQFPEKIRPAHQSKVQQFY